MTYTLTPADLANLALQAERFPAISPDQAARLSTLLGGAR